MLLERIEARILRELAISSKNFWELLEIIDTPLNNFLSALEKLRKEEFITVDKNGFHITEKGKEKINKKALELEGKICPHCFGKRIVPNGKFKEVLASFKKIVEKRPIPLLDFFQGYMLERDVIARLALMHYYGDLEGKDIVLMGDDDLLSIALALTGLPSSIVVLDIDKRFNDFLKNVNKHYGFDIKFFKYDVSKPIPKKFRGKFDVFSSEPLETFSGLKAFIIRGLSCLKENGVGYFGLTNYEASLKKWLKVQELLVKMNCVITDIIQGFSVYPTNYDEVNYEEFANKLSFEVGKNPGINWYKSALIRFEMLEKNLPRAAYKKMKIEYIGSEDLTHPYFKKLSQERL
jgi:predicted methyltransferase